MGNTWVFQDGTVLPVISGGDGPEDGDEGAPEGTVATITNTPAEGGEAKTFTEDEVAAICRQEKDKLYKEIESEREKRKEMEGRVTELQKNVEAFNTDRQAQLDAEKAAQDAAEAERKAREEADLSAKDLLAKREAEFEKRLEESENKWAAQFEELNERASVQEATLEKERAFAVISEYKNAKITEHGDDIMPHLHRLVTGNTTEEIDASISSAIQLTSDIMEDMTQAAAIQRGPRGVPATGASPTGPMENQSEQQHLTAEDLRNMSMEQYEQLRPQLLAQARPT
jgi:hypothetical protein